MSDLERAIEIAAAAHRGQQDKAGAPYILHPLRVMQQMTNNDERIVAVLHDVVEDTDWTIERLGAEGFSQQILDAIDSVTKRPEDKDDYAGFIERAARNPIGRAVKIADLRDNSDLTRIASPTDRDRARLERYRKALAALGAA